MRKDILIEWLAKNGQSLTDYQLGQLAVYQELVLTAPINLTAITSDEDFAIKHFIDSMTLLPYIDNFERNVICIDIGTGAGFPGIPLKIARPELRITLLDSLLKRVLFLRRAVKELDLQDIEAIHARAEDVKVRYDVAMARAVARLDKLLGYALPLVKPGGVFLAMKGPEVQDEIKNAKPILDKFGAVVESIETIEIAPQMCHTVVSVKRY
ncbi:MAG: 16S rRNA (guanine(527)-N(7))-methyltransferase RsmG [Defluviitaleaceae bacterium]|nr:16S rRNA (guanine(527)-N(7))-methyltransferase RsmG [Defluviitaleaceae bacterium]